MAYIGKKPEDAFRGLAYYDTFTGDGSTTTFDLSADAPDGGQNDITVVVDNVRQEPGASKSYTLGLDDSSRYRRITFNVAPDNGSEIYAINPGRSTQLNTVSDNAITTAKLYADAVTGAKIADDAIDSEHIVDGSIDNVHLAGSIANAKLANSTITINGTAVSLGGSVTAGTDWQAVTVADGSTTLNAVAGKGYFLDTNAGVIEVFLPTSPTRGDTVILMDYAGTFATNQVIVNTGGANLDSTTTVEYKLTTNDTIAEFIYVDSAKGWVTRINTTTGTTPSGVFNAFGGYDTVGPFIAATGGTVTTSGDYKIHTFTGDGCFVVTNQGTPAGSTQVDYLVVAGGGGGGVTQGGGGGAGGYRESSGAASGCYTVAPRNTCVPGITVSAATYPITVGGGGAAAVAPAPTGNGGNGSNSVFSTITSTGGGGASNGGSGTAQPGGSGGGGHGFGPSVGGSGNTPPTSPLQGNNGGNGPTGDAAGAGGGGAATNGSNGGPRSNPGGPGGCGVASSITGSPVTRGGGGGAGTGGPPGPLLGGTGGSGGGGSGGGSTGGACTGVANTGGGGGGGGNPSGIPSPGGNAAAGGKGIVIIRYKFQ